MLKRSKVLSRELAVTQLDIPTSLKDETSLLIDYNSVSIFRNIQ
jgi:hypothetical protein